MKQFFAIVKKEFRESHATFRLYILIGAFLILGMLSPLLANLLPFLMESMVDMGFVIEAPEPVAMDSWVMFFDNIGEMGIFALVIVFCGLMSNEFSRGTLINLLTKGLKRSTVIFAKLTSAAIMWTAAYLLAIAVCYVYTAYFWEAIPLNHAFLAFFAPWLFGIFLLTILIFGGTLTGNFYGGLLGCLLMLVSFGILGMFSSISRFVPLRLAGGTVGLITETAQPSDFYAAIVVCFILIFALTAGSVFIFNKKKV
jgi:ABC-2 type transport system permease protein